MKLNKKFVTMKTFWALKFIKLHLRLFKDWGFSCAAVHHTSSAVFMLLSQPKIRQYSSYRGRGLWASWEHLALQLEHAQVYLGGGCGRVYVSHHLQSLHDILVLLLPVASHQKVRVTVRWQDSCRNRRVWLFNVTPRGLYIRNLISSFLHATSEMQVIIVTYVMFVCVLPNNTFHTWILYMEGRGNLWLNVLSFSRSVGKYKHQ